MLAAFKVSLRNSRPQHCARNAANIHRLGITLTKRKYIDRSFIDSNTLIIFQMLGGREVPLIETLPKQLDNASLPKSSSLGLLGTITMEVLSKDGRTDGRMDGWTDGRMDGWRDGRKDEWTDGRTDGRGRPDRTELLKEATRLL